MLHLRFSDTHVLALRCEPLSFSVAERQLQSVGVISSIRVFES